MALASYQTLFTCSSVVSSKLGGSHLLLLRTICFSELEQRIFQTNDQVQTGSRIRDCSAHVQFWIFCSMSSRRRYWRSDELSPNSYGCEDIFVLFSNSASESQIGFCWYHFYCWYVAVHEVLPFTLHEQYLSVLWIGVGK